MAVVGVRRAEAVFPVGESPNQQVWSTQAKRQKRVVFPIWAQLQQLRHLTSGMDHKPAVPRRGQSLGLARLRTVKSGQD